MGTAPGEVAGRPFRPIEELDRVVGAACWNESRLFEVVGHWAVAAAPEPRLAVWFAATARRHGELAAAWAERLPVRAGVERAALVRAGAPELADHFDALGSLRGGGDQMAVLVGSVLPRLHGGYVALFGSASAVREGPVMEVLARAGHQLGAEIADGRRLAAPVGDLLERAAPAAVALAAAFERSLGIPGVFPAVRAS